jgi:hypothetical protein
VQVNAFVSRADVNGDGDIDESEFVAAFDDRDGGGQRESRGQHRGKLSLTCQEYCTLAQRRNRASKGVVMARVEQMKRVQRRMLQRGGRKTNASQLKPRLGYDVSASGLEMLGVQRYDSELGTPRALHSIKGKQQSRIQSLPGVIAKAPKAVIKTGPKAVAAVGKYVTKKATVLANGTIGQTKAVVQGTANTGVQAIVEVEQLTEDVVIGTAEVVTEVVVDSGRAVANIATASEQVGVLPPQRRGLSNSQEGIAMVDMAGQAIDALTRNSSSASVRTARAGSTESLPGGLPPGKGSKGKYAKQQAHRKIGAVKTNFKRRIRKKKGAGGDAGGDAGADAGADAGGDAEGGTSSRAMRRRNLRKKVMEGAAKQAGKVKHGASAVKKGAAKRASLAANATVPTRLGGFRSLKKSPKHAAEGTGAFLRGATRISTRTLKNARAARAAAAAAKAAASESAHGIDSNAFWMLFEMETGASQVGLHRQSSLDVQKKLVRAVRDYALAKHCWYTLVVPTLVAAEGLEEEEALFLAGDGDTIHTPQKWRWLLRKGHTAGGRSEQGSVSAIVSEKDDFGAHAHGGSAVALDGDQDGLSLMSQPPSSPLDVIGCFFRHMRTRIETRVEGVYARIFDPLISTSCPAIAIGINEISIDAQIMPPPPAPAEWAASIADMDDAMVLGCLIDASVRLRLQCDTFNPTPSVCHMEPLLEHWGVELGVAHPRASPSHKLSLIAERPLQLHLTPSAVNALTRTASLLISHANTFSQSLARAQTRATRGGQPDDDTSNAVGLGSRVVGVSPSVNTNRSLLERLGSGATTGGVAPSSDECEWTAPAIQAAEAGGIFWLQNLTAEPIVYWASTAENRGKRSGRSALYKVLVMPGQWHLWKGNHISQAEAADGDAVGAKKTRRSSFVGGRTPEAAHGRPFGEGWVDIDGKLVRLHLSRLKASFEEQSASTGGWLSARQTQHLLEAAIGRVVQGWEEDAGEDGREPCPSLEEPREGRSTRNMSVLNDRMLLVRQAAHRIVSVASGGEVEDRVAEDAEEECEQHDSNVAISWVDLQEAVETAPEGEQQDYGGGSNGDTLLFVQLPTSSSSGRGSGGSSAVDTTVDYRKKVFPSKGAPLIVSTTTAKSAHQAIVLPADIFLTEEEMLEEEEAEAEAEAEAAAQATARASQQAAAEEEEAEEVDAQGDAELELKADSTGKKSTLARGKTLLAKGRQSVAKGGQRVKKMAGKVTKGVRKTKQNKRMSWTFDKGVKHAAPPVIVFETTVDAQVGPLVIVRSNVQLHNSTQKPIQVQFHHRQQQQQQQQEEEEEEEEEDTKEQEHSNRSYGKVISVAAGAKVCMPLSLNTSRSGAGLFSLRHHGQSNWRLHTVNREYKPTPCLDSSDGPGAAGSTSTTSTASFVAGGLELPREALERKEEDKTNEEQEQQEEEVRFSYKYAELEDAGAGDLAAIASKAGSTRGLPYAPEIPKLHRIQDPATASTIRKVQRAHCRAVTKHRRQQKRAQEAAAVAQAQFPGAGGTAPSMTDPGAAPAAPNYTLRLYENQRKHQVTEGTWADGTWVPCEARQRARAGLSHRNGRGAYTWERKVDMATGRDSESDTEPAYRPTEAADLMRWPAVSAPLGWDFESEWQVVTQDSTAYAQSVAGRQETSADESNEEDEDDGEDDEGGRKSIVTDAGGWQYNLRWKSTRAWFPKDTSGKARVRRRVFERRMVLVSTEDSASRVSRARGERSLVDVVYSVHPQLVVHNLLPCTCEYALVQITHKAHGLKAEDEADAATGGESSSLFDSATARLLNPLLSSQNSFDAFVGGSSGRTEEEQQQQQRLWELERIFAQTSSSGAPALNEAASGHRARGGKIGSGSTATVAWLKLSTDERRDGWTHSKAFAMLGEAEEPPCTAPRNVFMRLRLCGFDGRGGVGDSTATNRANGSATRLSETDEPKAARWSSMFELPLHELEHGVGHGAATPAISTGWMTGSAGRGGAKDKGGDASPSSTGRTFDSSEGSGGASGGALAAQDDWDEEGNRRKKFHIHFPVVDGEVNATPSSVSPASESTEAASPGLVVCVSCTSRRVVLYSHFWIVNKTGVSLKYQYQPQNPKLGFRLGRQRSNQAATSSAPIAVGASPECFSDRSRVKYYGGSCTRVPLFLPALQQDGRATLQLMADEGEGRRTGVGKVKDRHQWSSSIALSLAGELAMGAAADSASGLSGGMHSTTLLVGRPCDFVCAARLTAVEGPYEDAPSPSPSAALSSPAPPLPGGTTMISLFPRYVVLNQLGGWSIDVLPASMLLALAKGKEAAAGTAPAGNALPVPFVSVGAGSARSVCRFPGPMAKAAMRFRLSSNSDTALRHSTATLNEQQTTLGNLWSSPVHVETSGMDEGKSGKASKQKPSDGTASVVLSQSGALADSEDTIFWLRDGVTAARLMVRVGLRSLAALEGGTAALAAAGVSAVDATIYIVVREVTSRPPVTLANRSSTQTIWCHEDGLTAPHHRIWLPPCSWQAYCWQGQDTQSSRQFKVGVGEQDRKRLSMLVEQASAGRDTLGSIAGGVMDVGSPLGKGNGNGKGKGKGKNDDVSKKERVHTLCTELMARLYGPPAAGLPVTGVSQIQHYETLLWLSKLELEQEKNKQQALLAVAFPNVAALPSNDNIQRHEFRIFENERRKQSDLSSTPLGHAGAGSGSAPPFDRDFSALQLLPNERPNLSHADGSGMYEWGVASEVDDALFEAEKTYRLVPLCAAPAKWVWTDQFRCIGSSPPGADNFLEQSANSLAPTIAAAGVWEYAMDWNGPWESAVMASCVFGKSNQKIVDPKLQVRRRVWSRVLEQAKVDEAWRPTKSAETRSTEAAAEADTALQIAEHTATLLRARLHGDCMEEDHAELGAWQAPANTYPIDSIGVMRHLHVHRNVPLRRRKKKTAPAPDAQEGEREIWDTSEEEEEEEEGGSREGGHVGRRNTEYAGGHTTHSYRHTISHSASCHHLSHAPLPSLVPLSTPPSVQKCLCSSHTALS